VVMVAEVAKAAQENHLSLQQKEVTVVMVVMAAMVASTAMGARL